MIGEQCPYCNNKNPMELQHVQDLDIDKHSPHRLEFYTCLHCSEGFFVVRNIKDNQVVANFKRATHALIP